MGHREAPPSGSEHMAYLRAIWNAPFDPAPLLRYADWLDRIGLDAAAILYREMAAGAASGRLRPDYHARSWLDEYWD